jgi:chromosome partitioning protein
MSLPHVVSVVTQKGGAGKSTMALSLGCHWYMKHQHPVGFIDADPQESLAQAVTGGPLEKLLKAVECREGAILDAIAQHREDCLPLLIDTKGDVNGTTLEAVQMSDLVLVPFVPSRYDWNSSLVTLRHCLALAERRATNPVRPPLRILVVLSQTKHGTKQARQYRADLEAEGFQVAETELHHRVAYSEALEFGVAPTLFEPRGDAAKEIAELADEIEALATAKKARLKEAV